MKKRYLGFICLLYSFIIIYVWLFDKLSNYLAPNMVIYLKISLIPMLIISIVLIFSNDMSYHFRVSDIVLLLPIVMLIISGDGRLSLDFASNRMMNYTTKEEDSSEVINDEDNDDSLELEQNYDFTNVDFNVIDASFDELANYLTYNEKSVKYIGKTIRVRGFTVKYASYIPKGYFSLGKYVVSCCVADSTYTGFIVKYDPDKVRHNSWYEIEGVLEQAKDKEGTSIIAIKAINVKEIDGNSEEQYVYPCYAYDNGICGEVAKYNLDYE